MDNSVKITVPLLTTILVFFICMGMFTGWFASNRSFMESSLKTGTKTQLNVNANLLNRAYPKIQGNNIRIKKGKDLNIKEHIKAIDDIDGDITASMNIYGIVNLNNKGIYKVRCVVRNSAGLKTVRYIQIVVD